jgi:hypothetical protein
MMIYGKYAPGVPRQNKTSPSDCKGTMPLDDLQNRINKLQAFDFGQELQTIISDNLEALPVYLKQQLAAGKDGNDEPNTIFGRSGYSPRTVEIKEANGVGLGAVTDRITNYSSGEFYNTVREELEGRVFSADSDVPYFADIRLYSSESLLKINERNRLDFANTITLPAIKAALLSKTGLKITGG